MTPADAHPDERVWEEGWDEHERRQRARLGALSLYEKLGWLEEAHRLVLHLRKGRPAETDRASEGEIDP